MAAKRSVAEVDSWRGWPSRYQRYEVPSGTPVGTWQLRTTAWPSWSSGDGDTWTQAPAGENQEQVRALHHTPHSLGPCACPPRTAQPNPVCWSRSPLPDHRQGPLSPMPWPLLLPTLLHRLHPGIYLPPPGGMVLLCQSYLAYQSVSLMGTGLV